MKTISLTQPWASLIALGAKRFETRSWAPRHRGLLAIHAAKGFPPSCKRICLVEPFLSALGKEHIQGMTPGRLDGGGLVHTLPLGAVLGVVELVGCVETQKIRDGISDFKAGVRPEAPISPQEYAFGDYSSGRFAWELRLLKRFEVPVPMNGALGLWECPGDLLLEWTAAKENHNG
ncbi:MAG: ASCH domain-containing protein [Patescibacteria group bacterium]|nr:ASCH domain-containing protein [Patescibacteria group bacterium]